MIDSIKNWRKSTRSGSQQECVEVGNGTDVRIRDTKLGEASPVLAVTPAAWKAFLAGL